MTDPYPTPETVTYEITIIDWEPLSDEVLKEISDAVLKENRPWWEALKGDK